MGVGLPEALLYNATALSPLAKLRDHICVGVLSVMRIPIFIHEHSPVSSEEAEDVIGQPRSICHHEQYKSRIQLECCNTALRAHMTPHSVLYLS